MNHTGFTGSREGMTQLQSDEVQRLIQLLDGKFHHGDCVGADFQAHRFAELNDKLEIVIHPPVKTSLRAYCKNGVVLPPKEYLKRNKDIVDACGWLIAAPKDRVQKGGTWWTINYARMTGTKVVVVYPDGTREFDG